MKVFYKISFLIIIFSIFISCKKNEFEVTKAEIRLIPKSQIENLEITEKYLSEFVVKKNLYISDEESANTQNILNPDEYRRAGLATVTNSPKNGDLYESLDSNGKQELDDYFNEKIRKEEERQDKMKNDFLKITNLKGINSNIEIKNKTEEVIEIAFLTVRIIFKFKNKDYSYSKPYSLLGKNETWKADETFNFNLNDITSFAIGNSKVLDIHIPENVTIEFYLTAKNSVGYQNLQKEVKELRENGFYKNKEFSYGKLSEKILSEKEILGFGEKIFDENITDIWNTKNTNSEKNIKSAKVIKNNHLKNYELQNAVQISISPDLELRDENSKIGRAMNNFRDDYNKKNTNKMGKSDLVFQPKGTNKNEKNAISDVTRVTVEYLKMQKNDLLKWNANLTSQNTNLTNELLKKEILKAIDDLPFQTELLKWNPIETGFISNQSYLKTSYYYLVNGDKTYTESYQFFNWDEKVIISVTTGSPNQEKWKKTFEESINTFKKKKKK